MNIRIGKISKLMFPDYGQCRRCRTTWNLVAPHVVYYQQGHGLFRLCEKCWQDVAPVDRLPYFDDVRVAAYWPAVAAAVASAP